MSAAPLLLSAALAAAAARPTLSPEAQLYFGRQLAVLVARVQTGLDAKGIHCVPGPGPGSPQTPAADPATWVSPEAIPTRGGLQPARWQLFLACETPGKAPFRMGVGLNGAKQPVPREKVTRQGEGFAIRDIGGNTLMLLAGRFQVLDDLRQFQAEPAAGKDALARGVVAYVAAEEGPGTPTALEVLGKLDPKALEAALVEICALAGPAPTPAAAPALPAYVASDEPAPAPFELDLPADERVGVVMRQLDPDEAAYFAHLRARTAEAALAALKPLGACDLVADDDDRRADLAMLGPGGFVADLEQGIECSAMPKTWLAVKPLDAAHPRTKDSPLMLDEGATLLLSDQLLTGWQKVRLVVGRLVEEPETASVVPGLMRPATVVLEANGEPAEVVRAMELLSKVELAPLRALLAHPPKPPAARRTAAEGLAPKGDRAEVEAEVFRVVFEQFAKQQVVVRAESKRDSLGQGFVRLAALAMPDLALSAIVDFNRAAATSSPFPEFKFRLPVVRVTERRHSELFEAKDRDGWEAFREAYPGAGPILTLSRVGLSRDRTQAVVTVEWTADWLAGAGEIWFLKKTASGWQIAYRMRRWIS